MSFWDQLVAEFESLGQVIAEWLPRILVALLILMNWSFVQGMFDRAGITGALATSDQTAAGITATIAYAYLVVVLWLIVFRVLQVQTLEDLLERFLAWIPTVLLAVLIVVIAAALATWVAGLVKPFADSKGVGWLTVLVHVGVILFGVLFALDLLEVTFAEDITKILIGSGAIAFAIAFGVGGIDTAKKWWAKYLSPQGSDF
jgi:hypothetical protein